VDPRFGRANWFIVINMETGEYQVASNAQNLNASQGAGIQSAENISRYGVGVKRDRQEEIMPRPPKCRRVEQLPGYTYFKPAGVPLPELFEVVLSVEELEAIRLRDLTGVDHEECAAKMSVSRPTFHRILTSARRKIAHALVNGEALRVKGGNFEPVHYRLKCVNCGHQWEGTVCRRRTVCPLCHGNEWQKIDV